jgi:hypothetical protein
MHMPTTHWNLIMWWREEFSKIDLFLGWCSINLDALPASEMDCIRTCVQFCQGIFCLHVIILKIWSTLPHHRKLVNWCLDFFTFRPRSPRKLLLELISGASCNFAPGCKGVDAGKFSRALLGSLTNPACDRRSILAIVTKVLLEICRYLQKLFIFGTGWGFHH